ncbi:MAG: pilus assembly protein PilM [Fibrobacter sp.]|nr:pilus assembly protein PilM [Fibrobacter sp.]
MKNDFRYISGLDIQSDYISVAQYSSEQDAVLLIAIQPISAAKSPDLLTNAETELRGLKNKFKFHSPNVVCSIPSEYAIIKHLCVDSDEPDLREAVQWEIAQQVIGTVEQYSFDFEECRNPDDDSRRVLAAAYRNDSVRNLSSMLKNVKLNPVVLDLDIFALINVYEANYKENLHFDTVLVHSEGEKTKLVLTKNGQYLDCEIFEYEYDSLEPATYLQRLQGEINRFASINNIDDGEGILRVMFSGSLFSQQEYRASARGFMGSGEILNPFRIISCKAGIDGERLAQYSPQLAVAVGLALRGND